MDLYIFYINHLQSYPICSRRTCVDGVKGQHGDRSNADPFITFMYFTVYGPPQPASPLQQHTVCCSLGKAAYKNTQLAASHS